LIKRADRQKPGRRPATSVSARLLEGVLGELAVAKAGLAAASDLLRGIDARVRTWDLTEPFQARRGRALREETAALFARALDVLHELLVRLADRSLAPAFVSRLSAPRKRRLQAKIRQELRYLQRAFDGGSLLLARTLDAPDIGKV
jgi:hypothetical protein